MEFTAARKYEFIVIRGGAYRLGDQSFEGVSLTPGSYAAGIDYGPEIKFCPFCGKALGVKQSKSGADSEPLYID